MLYVGAIGARVDLFGEVSGAVDCPVDISSVVGAAVVRGVSVLVGVSILNKFHMLSLVSELVVVPCFASVVTVAVPWSAVPVIPLVWPVVVWYVVVSIAPTGAISGVSAVPLLVSLVWRRPRGSVPGPIVSVGIVVPVAWALLLGSVVGWGLSGL